MPPKANTTNNKLGPEDFAERSAYGDKHAVTEDKMMVAHAQTLYDAGIIDEYMKSQLSQPWHRGGELQIKYTKEYMAMSPLYTGSNAHEMPTYEEALKRQKERDAAQKKFLADFATGKIDEDGNKIHSFKKPFQPHQKKPEAAEANDDTVSASTAEQQVHSGNSATTSSSSPSSSNPFSGKQNNKANRSFQRHHQNTPLLPRTTSKNPFTTSSSASPSSSSITTATKPRPKPAPLLPNPQLSLPATMPSKSPYTNYNYFELAALCRERNIPSGGKAPVLRARLIQDDINMETGKEREVKKYKNSGRREYRTVAPVLEVKVKGNGKRKLADQDKTEDEDEGVRIASKKVRTK